jgi:hypothetical protein
MTQTKDPLLEICKPYLLDVISAVNESLKYPDDSLHELMEGKNVRLRTEEYAVINKLTPTGKIKLLSEISTWLLEGEIPPINNQ